MCLALIAAVLFLPRDLKLDDIKETNVITAIMQYGIPEDIRTDDEDGVYLVYGNKVDVYGVTPWSFAVYPEADCVVFFFHSDDGADVYRKIAGRCDLEENLLNSFHKFSYDDLHITTYGYDASYVRIEID